MSRTEMSGHVVDVVMGLESLAGAPGHELPRPYSFRWYRRGDEAVWTDIWQRADQYNTITPDRFQREFGADARALTERQCYLLDGGGQPIGTATAWFHDDEHGPVCGRVHWVAIVPEMQGRGLAKPLLAAVLDRMKELGYRRAFLHTQPPRIAAIRLYLGFGFRPEVRTEQERATWRSIREQVAPSPLDGLDLGQAG